MPAAGGKRSGEMFRRKNRLNSEIISQINDVSGALARANRSLDECGDPLLMEANVYQIKYLKAKYAYLMKTAKENGVCDETFSKVKK